MKERTFGRSKMFLEFEAVVEEPVVTTDSEDPREELSCLEWIPSVASIGCIKSVFKVYVRVIAMMGKLVLRVTTGKR